MGEPAARILVVEDEEAHAQLVTRAFERFERHFELVTVGSLEEARRALEKGPFNLALVDLVLPDGEGIDLLASAGVPARFPTVVMTSYGNEGTAVEAMKAGALDYVVKTASSLADMPHIVERTLREWQYVLERRRLEDDRAHLLERIQAQNATVVRLATHPALAEGHLDRILPAIAEETAETISVDRVQICRMTPDGREIECLEAFERTSDSHSLGDRLVVGRFPTFIAALKEGRVVDACDVRTDARTAELTQACWEPLGITSTLTAPVRLRGEMIGIACLDQRGRQRAWSPDEVAFAGQVADLVAEAFLTADLRRRAEELAAITRVSREITSVHNLKQVLQSIARNAAELCRSDASGVFAFRLNGRLYVEAGVGVGGRFIDAINAHGIPLGCGAIGRAVASRVPVQVLDTQSETGYEYAAIAALEQVRSVLAAPMLRGEEVTGGIVLWHREVRYFSGEELAFLQALAQQCVNAIENARLFEGLQNSNLELSLAYDTTLEGWSRALELRDRETEGHTRRVVDLAIKLARAMGVREADLIHVRRGAILHDIGKLAIPDSLLLKAGPLSDEEWAAMRRHTEFAYQLLSPIDFLLPALDIPYCHHEKWDGSGYPRGLSGEQIPLSARVFAVVDVWDALRSDRPYRKAWSREQVEEHIESLSGTAFDPRVVEAFFRVLAREPD